MDVQVWSDVVCPWCYIGRRRLEVALRQFGGAASVTYRAYQLDPSPVPQALPMKAVMAAKFGGPERVEQMFAHVTSIAAHDGLTLDFERAVAANTFDAHRLIAWAAGRHRQADMLDALQQAYFVHGADLGSWTTLGRVAASIGLDESAVLAALGSTAGAPEVNADIVAARELGITSVPTFVIDGRYAIQGAQETATLVTAFAEVVRRADTAAGH